jgi:RND family efflux transporter MFP subunit
MSARARTAQLLAEQLATREQLAQADKAVSDAQSVLDALQKSNGGKPTQTLQAPFDGIVTAIPIAPGDTVAPGAPLITVARADRIVVTVGIEPSDRNRVKLGDVVDLSPVDGGASLTGKVFRVDNVLNPRSRLIDVDISAGPDLLPGAAFKAAITVGEFKGWLVPRDAVLADAQSSYVFQVSGAKAVRIAVTVLANSGNTTVVDGPIDPAKPMVTQGNYQLTDGMAVRIAGATGKAP